MLLLALMYCSTVFGAPQIPDSCYASVGCFSNLSPWTSSSRPALPPQHPLNVSSSMFYYSSDVLDGIVFPIYPDINVSELPFDGNRSTFVIFDESRSSATMPWIISLKNALLRREDSNIFVAEYGRTDFGGYEQAVSNARVMGKLAALVIQALGVDPSALHLIGHGLGAHVASYTANNVGDNGVQVGRITGLEPMRQFFEGEPSEVQLDASDADFVDVLHTNAGEFGITTPSGDIDFYFNGGTEQPMCRDAPSPAECSHDVVCDLYVEAIERGCLLGKPAELELDQKGSLQNIRLALVQNVTVSVGIEMNLTAAKGIFIVQTNLVSPYCNESRGMGNVKIAPY